MSEYKVTVQWERKDQPFTDNRYNRGHSWVFDGLTVPGSSSPHIVPHHSNAAAVDPEEAFVASLSSCHMLFFLSISATRGLRVDSYSDTAVGILAKDEDGRLVMSKVTLHPRVVFSGERLPTRSEIEEIHHQSHEECFIANSVKTVVACEPMYD